MAASEIDPLALLDRDLAALEREEVAKPRWDPADAEKMIDWLEGEFGLVVRRVPKIERIVREILASLMRRERLRVLVVGPRGGGKTFLAAAVQLLSMRFFGASWTSIGGSLEQATRLFAHVRAAVQRSADLQKFIVEALATRITARNGATISVHAASEKSIRGQHPRGPSGAGGIVLDEAALIEDSLIDAAIPQVASADPSMILQLSTLGELQTGRFWELLQDHAERGYQLFEFGIFDVVRRCPYDCQTTCPVPAFAKDAHQESATGKLAAIRKALCAGKAHEPDGWIAIDEVAQQYKDLPRESFVREFLGSSSTRVGAVYATEDIDEATAYDVILSKTSDVNEHRSRFRRLEKAVGLDWGFSGETWAVYLLRLRDTLLVYRWEYWTHTRFSEIREHLVDRIFTDQITRVLPDAANPSDNDELAQMLRRRTNSPHEGDFRDFEWECQVEPVKFATEKSYGIGEVRRRLENRLLLLPAHFAGEPVLNYARAIRLLKAYHVDHNGQPVKKADHCPDALMCGALRWAPRQYVEPHIY